jgi:cysteine desulfurase/selenocysteine lyase
MSFTSSNTSSIDIEKIRAEFPILHQKINGKPLVYLDNAASTQKPQLVIDALVSYYTTINANIHRGIHTLSERATTAFEESRIAVKDFIRARHAEEIIFTRGTTESINLVASTWGRQNISKGDVIVLSAMEHHSNQVPWQMLAQEKGAIIRYIPFNELGELQLDEYENILKQNNVKLVAINHVSNSLGTVNPLKEITTLAKSVGAIVLADGAQAASHLDINVQDLGVDFYAFSAHKLYGPTGVGILYGTKAILEAMPPYQGGGEMISEVTYEGCSFNELPYKFEAGTPNIADTIALKAALDFINTIGASSIRAHEEEVYQHAANLVKEIDGLRIIGQAKDKVGVLSFVIDGIHHQDLGILLDQGGIAIRTGHHCTQPLMSKFNITGTSRASFAIYNTIEEAEILVAGIKNALKMLR